jgi:hypothetical protein
MVAATVTERHAQDPSHVPELLSQIEREIDRFIGDGMYDKEPVYAAGAQHAPGAQVMIPPRQKAVLSPTGTTSPCKRTCGDCRRAKQEEFQEREASLACALLNRILELGRPQSSPVS